MMNKTKVAKSFRKPPPIAATNVAGCDKDSDVQFEVELCWCIQQLEISLQSGKLSQKIADDTVKNIKTLKSATAPAIKKRQIMKAALGDYRAKMKEEERKMALASKKIRFTPSTEISKKSNFVKKSAVLTSGKDFRFNFNCVEAEEVASRQEDVVASKIPAFCHKDLDLNAGNGFKFNFPIDDINEDFNFDKLTIKK